MSRLEEVFKASWNSFLVLTRRARSTSISSGHQDSLKWHRTVAVSLAFRVPGMMHRRRDRQVHYSMSSEDTLL